MQWFRLVLHVQRREHRYSHVLAHTCEGRVIEQNIIACGIRLEARSDIDSVTNSGVALHKLS